MGEAGEAIEETGEMSRVRDKRAPESTGSVAAADGMVAFEDSSEVRGDFIPVAAELTRWSPGERPWRPFFNQGDMGPQDNPHSSPCI